MKPDVKALWGLGWRMVLFIPLSLLGLAAFILVLGLTFMAPFYAVILLLNGQYLWGGLCLGLWLVWLRVGKRVRHTMAEGFKDAAM